MRGTEQDWSILQTEGVISVIDQAARKVNRQYTFTELDDLKQDGRIAVVNTPALRECVEGTVQLGLLQYRLMRDLIDGVKTEGKQRDTLISYTQIEDNARDGIGHQSGYVAVATASSDYTRESVETLLPAVWDEAFCYGLPVKDTAPDPDMPKGSSNKSHGNNLSAYIADIKTGWQKAPLSVKERRSLLLRYGFDWTQASIAFNQGVSQRTVSTWLFTGVGKVVAELNGGDFTEFLGDPE